MAAADWRADMETVRDLLSAWRLHQLGQWPAPSDIEAAKAARALDRLQARLEKADRADG
jgi:hypothetical protein